MTIYVVARVQALPDAVGAVRQILQGLVAPTHREPGCLQYDLLEATEDPGLFVFIERWQDQAALNLHLASPHLAEADVALTGLLAAEAQIVTYRPVNGAEVPSG